MLSRVANGKEEPTNSSIESACKREQNPGDAAVKAGQKGGSTLDSKKRE